MQDCTFIAPGRLWRVAGDSAYLGTVHAIATASNGDGLVDDRLAVRHVCAAYLGLLQKLGHVLHSESTACH